MLQNVTKFKTGGKDRWWMLPSFAGMALLLLLFAMLCPSNVQLVHAEGDAGATTFSGWLSSSVTLSISDKVEGNIEPTVSGAFKNISTVANVMVTNSDYYDISIKGSPNMTGRAGNSSQIGAIANDQKAADFATNTWGYYVSKNTSGTTATPVDANTVYKPMKDTNTAVVTQHPLGDSLSANDYYTLNFGAKVDTSLPADTYTSEVVLSVVASPKQVYGFDRTDTMQGMTADICKEIGTDADKSDKSQYAATDSLGNTYYTKQLKDTRDNKYYWVAKLKDGNCWMTQNLALDIPASGLTSELTALAPGKTSWKPAEGTRVLANMTEEERLKRFTIEQCPAQADGEASGFYGEGNSYADEKACLNANADYSWDEGEYVIAYPGMGDNELWDGRTATQGGLSGFADTDWISSKGINPAMLKDGKVVIDVSGSEWTASTNKNFTTDNDGFAVNTETHEYDSHYLIGNYYQWLAMTAQSVAEGESVTTEGQSVQGSICAKNWQLALSGASHNAESGSFFNLVKSYAGDALKVGGTPGGMDAADTTNGYSSLTYIIANETTVGDIILGTPIQLFLNGYIVPWSSNREVRHVGSRGYFWSPVVMDGAYAVGYHISPWDVAPSIVLERALGITVRCLVNTVN